MNRTYLSNIIIMAKQIKYGVEAPKALEAGVNKLQADTRDIRTKGRNLSWISPSCLLITNDGVKYCKKRLNCMIHTRIWAHS